MDDLALEDLVARLGVAAGLEMDGVPAEELAEHDEECAELAASFGSFVAAYDAKRTELKERRLP